VVAAAQRRSPAALSLCGVQLLGAWELPLSEHMLQALEQPGGQAQPQPVVSPQGLRPFFTLPIDGDGSTCLQAPAAAGSGAMWELQLDGSYPLLAVQMVVAGAAGTAGAAANGTSSGGSGSRNGSTTGALAIRLLDAPKGGKEVAAWRPAPAGAHVDASSGSGSSHNTSTLSMWQLGPPFNTSGSSGSGSGGSSSSGGGNSSGSSGEVVWELPAALQAAAIRVQGFSSLCDVRVLAAAQQPSTGYLLQPTEQWQVVGGGASSDATASTGGGQQVSALFDGNPQTCLTLQPAAAEPATASSASAAPFLEVLLGRHYR